MDVDAYSSLLWKTLARRTSQCDIKHGCTVYFCFHAYSKNGGWKWTVHAFSKKKRGCALIKFLREVNGVAVHRSMVRGAFCEIKKCVVQGTPAAKTVFRVYFSQEHVVRHSSCVRSINRLTEVASITREQCSVYARRRGRPKKMQQMPAGATVPCVILRGSPDDAGETPNWRFFMFMSVVTFLLDRN